MGYSLDFRKRILAYKYKHSLTFEQTSTHFDFYYYKRNLL
ncbi:transposase [Xenorhabdus sp. KK7.4]|nr:transposase [Xenorhabdus sp. KK7.4]